VLPERNSLSGKQGIKEAEWRWNSRSGASGRNKLVRL
jgi:hypothetical protein